MFKTTYPNINISVLCISRRWETQSLTDFLKYLPKNMALSVKNCGFPMTLQKNLKKMSLKKKIMYSGNWKTLNQIFIIFIFQEISDLRFAKSLF